MDTIDKQIEQDRKERLAAAKRQIMAQAKMLADHRKAYPLPKGVWIVGPK